MTVLPPSILHALRYVHNTNGGATQANFIEDFEPVGEWLWDQLERYVRIDDDGKIRLTADDGKIRLTADGLAAIQT